MWNHLLTHQESVSCSLISFLNHEQSRSKKNSNQYWRRWKYVCLVIVFLLIVITYSNQYNFKLRNEKQIQKISQFLINFIKDKGIPNIIELKTSSCKFLKILQASNIPIKCQAKQSLMKQINREALKHPKNKFDEKWMLSLENYENHYIHEIYQEADSLNHLSLKSIVFIWKQKQMHSYAKINQMLLAKLLTTESNFSITHRVPIWKNQQETAQFVVFQRDWISFESNGAFFGSQQNLKSHHFYSQKLFGVLLELYQDKNVHSVVDFGGGLCTYAQKLDQLGYEVECYDGNIQTPQITKFGKVLDLTQKQKLGKTYDWVQSFEVGEHLPPSASQNYIYILTQHAREGIIISWALPGQGGYGHINQLSSAEVIDRVQKEGFGLNSQLTNRYRQMSEVWFRNDLLIFERIK